jgi:hypothetical protein
MSNLRGSWGYFDPMDDLILLGFIQKGRKDINTNDKKIRGEGVSLSEPPLRRERFSRVSINKNGERDS